MLAFYPLAARLSSQPVIYILEFEAPTLQQLCLNILWCYT